MSDKVKAAEAAFIEARMCAIRAKDEWRVARIRLLCAMIEQGNDEYKAQGLWPWDRLLAIYPNGDSEDVHYRGFIAVGERLAVKPHFVKVNPETNKALSKLAQIPPGTELIPIQRCTKGKL